MTDMHGHGRPHRNRDHRTDCGRGRCGRGLGRGRSRRYAGPHRRARRRACTRSARSTPRVRARPHARSTRASRAASRSGPLAGVPVAIKDLVCTRGLRTTFGSRLYAKHVPDEDDVVVERLRGAGAVIVGKTNTLGVRLRRVRPQPGVRDHAQSVEPRAHVGRLERRLGGGGGRGPGAARDRQRRRRLGPRAGRAVRDLRHQAVVGARAGLPRLSRTSAIRASRAGSRSSTSAR